MFNLDSDTVEISDPTIFRDIKRWAEKLIQVEGKPVVCYDYQDKFWKARNSNRVVVKARQIGMSWACAIEALWIAMHVPGQTILFVSRTYPQAVELLGHAKNAYYTIPDKIRLVNPTLPDGGQTYLKKINCKVIEDMMTFEHSDGRVSRIISLPNNPETVRGWRAHRVYWDEAAKFPHESEMHQAMMPTMARGGFVVFNSTHQGTNSIFYENCEKAKAGTSKFGYKYFETPWWDCPDPKYREYCENVKAEYGEFSFFYQEEFCCIASDENLAMFTHTMLKACIDLFNKKEGEGVSLPIRASGKFPIYAGVDVGRTKDLTVFIAFEQQEDYSRMIEMWEMRGKTFAEQEAKIIDSIKRLKPTHVRIDSKGVGMNLSERLATEFGGGRDVSGKALLGLIEPMDFSPLVKEKMVIDTYIAMNTGIVGFKEHQQLYAQLHNLRREVTDKTRTVRYVQSDSAMHDDYLWAFCMAVSQLTTGPQTGGMYIFGEKKSAIIGTDSSGEVEFREIKREEPKKAPIITKFQHDIEKYGKPRNTAKEKCECGADLQTVDARKGEYVCNGEFNRETGEFVRCHRGHKSQNLCTYDCIIQIVMNKGKWKDETRKR